MKIPTKKFRFFFHYNKPETQRTGKITISLHYKGACHLINDILCCVPTGGRFSKTAPRFAMEGYATKISIHEGLAVVE